VSLPIRRDQLARVLRGVADGMRGVRTKNVAGAICDFNLAVAAEQAAILFRLAIQQNGVIGIGLVQCHRHA
jgi:hypothetical protein